MNIPIHCCFYTCVTKQLLKNLGLHAAFNRSRGIDMAQSVHTESPDSCLIAQFVKMGIIGTVLCRFPGTPVDKDKIAHDQPSRA